VTDAIAAYDEMKLAGRSRRRARPPGKSVFSDGLDATWDGRCADTELPNRFALKQSAQECRGLIGDADNLVRCLAIELKVEFGLRSTVVPCPKLAQLGTA